jgi:hypothetical protein
MAIYAFAKLHFIDEWLVTIFEKTTTFKSYINISETP